MIREKLFSYISRDKLMYTTSWEDSAVDRKLLQLDHDSRVCVIGGAGDNPLHYLLDYPQSITCVDVNLAQISLMRLKKSLIQNRKRDALRQLFQQGRWREPLSSFLQLLAPLPLDSRWYWQRHHFDFTQPQRYGSFYYAGSSGLIAALFRWYLVQARLYDPVLDLFRSESHDQQITRFDALEPQIWASWLRWLMNQPRLLPFLGVPQNQYEYMLEAAPTPLDYMKRVIRHIFRETPLSDNYFWYVYLTGKYERTWIPPYLKPSNFDDLNHQIQRLKIRHERLETVVQQNNQSFSHFNLLDHLDWYTDSKALEQVWRILLQASEPGTKILFRSAAPNREFLPSMVHQYVTFDDELVNQYEKQDRVGTYMSTHLGIVTKPLS
jgi:S-adenosylmethionine-diacylglycerol 3-amino-3-carboxypropyl transferase